MKIFAQGFLSLFIGVLYSQVSAQSATDLNQAVQEAQRLQQLEVQRLNEQFTKDRSSPVAPSTLLVPEKFQVQGAGQGACRFIETIESQGITLLPASTIVNVTQNYVQRCLGVADIELLLAELTRIYIQKGWVSARVYLPEQDLSQGHLRLLVVEGKVSDVQVQADDKASISVGNVAPFMVGKPLNLRDVEQALDQINRLASNSASVDMLPGDLPGDTLVVLHNRTAVPVHANVFVDNHGAESTGAHQVSAGLSLDNPLGWNDYLSYTKKQTAPVNDRQRFGTSDSLSYLIPFGYTTLSVNASHSRYASSFTAPSGSRLSNSGNSKNYALRLDRVLQRRAASLWSAYANVGAKASESYLEGVLLSSTSRKMATLDVGTSLHTVIAGGRLGLDLGYSRGLTSFGALEDSRTLTASDAKAQFRKWAFSASYQKPFHVAGRALDFSTQWSGQYAQDVLYGSEQMMVGSIYTVRGFSQTSLSGDHGLNVRNEISMRTPFFWGVTAGSVRTWIGIDYGMVRSRNRGIPEGALTGLAIGAQFHTKQRIILDIFATKPLSKPSHMDFEPTRFWLRLGAMI